ncbi:MAG: hypothetical protein IT314_00175 [Anaerolineales bacterium]|nr:hypothetical protein [Anaerolineales bacterium]
MSAWFSKSLGDAMWAEVPAEEIKRLFQPLFDSSGKPAEMAIFTRREEGRLHCEVIAYFSPATIDIARSVEAEACPRPAREGLELLVGNEASWSALFVDGER